MAVCLMGTSAGAQRAGRATITSSMDSSGAVIAAMVSGDAAPLNIESSSGGQGLPSKQMGTIPFSGNNSTRLALIASGVQGKSGHGASLGYLLGFRERRCVAEIDQEMSAKSTKLPDEAESALWFDSTTG
jgi:hypothetical protein